MTDHTKNWEQVRDAGGLFFVSHSGGKDSQAMLAYLVDDLRIPADQLVVVHAHLGRIEWDGVEEHIHANDYGLGVNVIGATDKHGAPKTFLSMVAARGKWPSPSNRQCTSDLKRGPIYKFIRHTMKARGAALAVNCTGMRAEESAARSKKTEWAANPALSKAGREVYEWMPIHTWSTDQVFDRIYAAGQVPFHAYGKRGEKNQRLSCVFCIMGSVNDHQNGATHRPDLYAEVVRMEQEMDHTMFQGKTLEERNGLTVAEAYERHNLIPLENVA